MSQNSNARGRVKNEILNDSLDGKEIIHVILQRLLATSIVRKCYPLSDSERFIVSLLENAKEKYMIQFAGTVGLVSHRKRVEWRPYEMSTSI